MTKPWSKWSFSLLVLGSCTAAAASSITALGILPGKATSTAAGVSNDGQVVAGTSLDSRGTSNEAFKWTPATGPVGLGFLPGGSTSVARAISRDGTTIVGDAASSYAAPVGGTEAFRYRGGVMTALHGPTQLIMSQGMAVNADGSVVVDSNGNRRWTLSQGVEQNVILYAALGISDDGSVVVGRSSGFVAQEWTPSGGVVDLPGSSISSVANAVSGNGQVAVGHYNNVACYWSQSAGFVRIGTVGVISAALAVNGDGSIIVGRANTGLNGATEAFVWTAATGMTSLAGILTAQGVDLSGWLYKGHVSLVEATGISEDGHFLVGNGTKQGFLVSLELAAPLSAVEQWRLAHFGSSANSGDGADTADPDLDGLPNLLEYALGDDPRSAASAALPTYQVVAGRLVMGFSCIADPALTYTVEAASSLAFRDWSPIWSSTGSENIAGHVDVPDAVLLNAEAERYLRLKVSR